MANDKPIQPPMAALDPKALMAFSFLSTPEGAEYMKKQTELLDIQLQTAREIRDKNEASQAAAVRARRRMAELAREAEVKQKKNEDECSHMHQNGDHAIRGQRMAQGTGVPELDKGRKTWVARCQRCGKEFNNRTGLPNGWVIQQEHFGGPSF